MTLHEVNCYILRWTSEKPRGTKSRMNTEILLILPLPANLAEMGNECEGIPSISAKHHGNNRRILYGPHLNTPHPISSPNKLQTKGDSTVVEDPWNPEGSSTQIIGF